METFSSSAATTTFPSTTIHEPRSYRRSSSPYRRISSMPDFPSITPPLQNRRTIGQPFCHISTGQPFCHISTGSHTPSPFRLSSPSPTTYTRASTGYAAALLDVARCTGTLQAVEADARKLLPEVRRVPPGPRADQAVLKAVEETSAHRHLAKLMRCLVGKGRVDMVVEVLEVVGRLCDELRGTKVVVVTSEERMPKEELAAIADKVRQRSGAASVKVRHVRRLSCEGSLN